MATGFSHGSRDPRRHTGSDRHGFGRRPRSDRDGGYHGSRSHSQRDRYEGEGDSRPDRPARGQRFNREERDFSDSRRSSRSGQSPRSGQWDRDDRRRDDNERSSRDTAPRDARSSSRDRQVERSGRPERSGRSDRSGKFDRADRRSSRPPQHRRIAEPQVPDDVQASDLDASARRELRALGRANAENIARHLVMVQRLLDTDPAAAHAHARYACAHAGRVAVVREASAIAAYLSGHYQEALRDIRAARRLSGLDLHRAIEADCERALGHMDRALAAAEHADPRQLDDVEEAEIAMVVSSVRHAMGQTELGLVVIEEAILMFRGDRETLRRLHSVRADRLEDLGRIDEAQAVRQRIGDLTPKQPEGDVTVFDIHDEDADDGAEADAEHADATQNAENGNTDTGVDDGAPATDDVDPQTEADTSTTAGDTRDEAPVMTANTAEGQNRPAPQNDEADTPATAVVAPEAATSGTTSEETTEDDADWDASFSARVEAELAELLADNGITDASDAPDAHSNSADH